MGAFRQKSVEAELIDAVRRNRHQQTGVSIEDLANEASALLHHEQTRTSPTKRKSPGLQSSGSTPQIPSPQLHPARLVEKSSSTGKLATLPVSGHKASREPVLRVEQHASSSSRSDHSSPLQRPRVALSCVDELSIGDACLSSATSRTPASSPTRTSSLTSPSNRLAPIELKDSRAFFSDTAGVEPPRKGSAPEGHQKAEKQLPRSVATLTEQLEAMTRERDLALSEKAQIADIALALQADLEQCRKTGLRKAELRNRADALLKAKQTRSSTEGLSLELDAVLAAWAVSRVMGNAMATCLRRQCKDLLRERAKLEERVDSLSELPALLKMASSQIESSADAGQRARGKEIELMELLQVKEEEHRAVQEELLLTNTSYSELSERLRVRADEVDELEDEVRRLQARCAKAEGNLDQVWLKMDSNNMC